MKRAAILALFIVVPNLAQAATNFPALTDYPAPNCAKPGDKPVMAKDAPRVVFGGRYEHHHRCARREGL